MAKLTRTEKTLIRFAKSLQDDNSYGGHNKRAGFYLADALLREKVTTEKKAGE